MADLLERMQQEITDRLGELEPSVDEFERLRAAAAALGDLARSAPVAGAPSPVVSVAPRRRGPSRRGSKNRATKAVPAPTIVADPPAGGTPVPATLAPAAEISAPIKRRPKAVRGKAGGRKPRRAPLSANQRAILAALEHGAHTVRELVVVTGMSDQTVRNNVKGLVGLERVVKTERGGKAAYGLPGAVEGLAAAA